MLTSKNLDLSLAASECGMVLSTGSTVTAVDIEVGRIKTSLSLTAMLSDEDNADINDKIGGGVTVVVSFALIIAEREVAEASMAVTGGGD